MFNAMQWRTEINSVRESGGSAAARPAAVVAAAVPLLRSTWRWVPCATVDRLSGWQRRYSAGHGAGGQPVPAPRMVTAAALLLLMLAGASPTAAAGAAKRNVLYIVYDDLRPDLSMYTHGAPAMRTPHLQKLADGGLVFERAYCQQTVCSPSRMSFTTGRRPSTTKTWNFLNHFRQVQVDNSASNKHSCKFVNRVAFTGTPLAAGTRHPGGVSFNGTDGSVGMTGSSGQCCTDCSRQVNT